MNRTQWILMASLLVVALGVGYLAMRNRQPPMLPLDADHKGSVNTITCLSCHGPDGSDPRGANHPLGDDCLRCHGIH